MAKPHITGTTHELPFEKLSPRDFERMCLWLVRREGYPTAEHHGAAGSDRGRDIVARREEGLVAFQCKREKQFGPADAEQAVQGILAPIEDPDTGELVTPPTPARIILSVACDVSVTAREKAEKASNEIPTEVWARTELDERLKRHPAVVEEFFQLPKSEEPDEEALPVDLTTYLEALVDHTDHIKISGVSGGLAVKGALRHPIERLYTPLVSRGMPREEAGEGAPGHPFEDREEVTLADLLPRYPRLLIEGQPGAGKTTFLRFVACMLARDALDHPCPDGESWRRQYLGLEHNALPPTPVLLRIADLMPLLGAAGAPRLRTDDRRWLLDLLEQMSRDNEYPVSRRGWQTMLESGSAILLLDGLDEVAEETLRERLFDVFRDACRQWQCPIVVTSRPIQTAALREIGFESATIEPFGDREIRTFIDHWVAALHSAESVEDLRGEGQGYRADLLEAITERPRVRRLATNPVMLTCLCVVHWNEGRLPEGRSRVYRAVIRWLIASRRAQREEQGFTDWFAQRALARLALAMVDSPEGKRVIFDLEEGAVAVDALAQREFPELAADERRHRMRHWLRFECLASGLVEEVAGNRVRFWHLTGLRF